MIEYMVVFLVLLIPNSDKPVIALMAPFETVAECKVALAKAPTDRQWACIKIDLSPDEERPVKEA